LEKEVRLRPYSFEDSKTGKKIRGISVYQQVGREWEKLENFFRDPESKTEHAMGSRSQRVIRRSTTRDDWMAYFIRVRKFLMAYADEHIYPQHQEA
jgi:hypothetical protein